MEVWKDIPGFSRYRASSLGNIWSKRQNKEMRVRWNKGYMVLSVRDDDGRVLTRGVHQLVALAFKGPQPKGMICRHLDGVSSNCREDNLAWGTHSQNRLDDTQHGKGLKIGLTDAASIKRLIDFGFSNRAIADHFSISPEHVNRIRHGYCHVNPVLYDTSDTTNTSEGII